jgi:hypothetical protein
MVLGAAKNTNEELQEQLAILQAQVEPPVRPYIKTPQQPDQNKNP